MVDGTDTGLHGGGRRQLSAVVRFMLLTSLVVLLVVPSVLLGDAAWVGAGEDDAVPQSPGPGRDSPLVFQAIRCREWADVPGNFTPEVPVDDTEGRYRNWGPVDPAVVETVELDIEVGRCEHLDGVRFRLSASAWGADLLDAAPGAVDAAGEEAGPRFEGQHGSAEDPVTEGPVHPLPQTAGAREHPSGDSGPATSSVAGATGTDGPGRVAATTAELSDAQQAALHNGSGLWVAASGFEDTFANLRCHADRYNADNLEVLRAAETDTSMVCVLYVVHAGARAPAVDPPAAGPPALPAMDRGLELPLSQAGAMSVVTPSVPGSEKAPAASDPGAVASLADQATPADSDPPPVLTSGGSTGGGLGLDDPADPEGTAADAMVPNGMASGSRAVQEGLADLGSHLDPGGLLQRDPPLSAPHAIVAGTPTAGVTPTLPAAPLGPRLAGSRITALVGIDGVAQSVAPVTQNLTAALAAGLCALFLTGLGITIKVAGRPL